MSIPKIFRHQVGVLWLQMVTLCLSPPLLFQGQAASGPLAHTASHHLSHLVPICNKPGEGKDFGDPGEKAMWGNRIWPVLKGLKKKKFLPVKKLVILNRRQMLHIPEQCCPLFTALIVLNELERWK